MNLYFRLPQTDAVIAALSAYQPGRILRIGCGEDLITEELSRLSGMIATDTSFDRIEDIRAQCSNAYIVQAHPCQLPFAASSFDAVLCTQVIDHFDKSADRRLALEEMARVIRPDGRMIITVLHQNFRFDGFGIAKEGTSDGAYYHRYYLNEFRDQLAMSWRIESMWGVWSYLPKTYRIYTRLGRFVVYWERALRRLPLSLRYGKVLLAVCAPASS